MIPGGGGEVGGNPVQDILTTPCRNKSKQIGNPDESFARR